MIHLERNEQQQQVNGDVMDMDTSKQFANANMLSFQRTHTQAVRICIST